jgi:hypothetical protein
LFAEFVKEAPAARERKPEAIRYSPELAHPTPSLDHLLVFRSVNPLYGAFLLEQLGRADFAERLQALESVLELPGPVLKFVRVPRDFPPGPLATTWLDQELLRRGLIAAPRGADDEEEPDHREEEFDRSPSLAEKLWLLFEARFPEAADLKVQSVWAAGELLQFGGNFNNFVKARDLVKQEGLIFRHLLRLILLCGEFAQLCPPETDTSAWQMELRGLADRLTASCREVDPTSTDEIIESARAADVVEGETHRSILA